MPVEVVTELLAHLHQEFGKQVGRCFQVPVVWDKLMRGLSTRNYGAVVKDFREAYGVEKSAVSENFIASSREKLQALMERPLGELQLCAVLIDGTRSAAGR